MRSTRSAASTSSCGSARTSTSCGASTTPAGGAATTRRCRCGTNPRGHATSGSRQHAGYGTSAAPLALRHPAALSPLNVNGWTAATWVLALLGQSIPAVAVGAGSSAALMRKLPDVPPTAAWWLAVRGHLLAGTQFAHAARRVWWPILLVGAVVSRRCRWWLLLAAVERPASSSDRRRLRLGSVDGSGSSAHVGATRPAPQRVAGAQPLGGRDPLTSAPPRSSNGWVVSR